LKLRKREREREKETERESFSFLCPALTHPHTHTHPHTYFVLYTRAPGRRLVSALLVKKPGDRSDVLLVERRRRGVASFPFLFSCSLLSRFVLPLALLLLSLAAKLRFSQSA